MYLDATYIAVRRDTVSKEAVYIVVVFVKTVQRQYWHTKALETFCGKWGKLYKKVTQGLLENPYLLTFYQFPKDIWRSIYSTNLIESFNKLIKKYTMRKEQFPNEGSLERFLVTQFEDCNERFSTRCHIGFNKAIAALEEMCESLKSNLRTSSIEYQSNDLLEEAEKLFIQKY